MKRWSQRPKEVAYLLNPAFCARILYKTISQYQKEKKEDFPFVLVYLILPIILHKNTREKIDSRTKMHIWLQKNPEVLITFSKRCKSLVKITNEAIEFLLRAKIIEITENGGINICKFISASKEKQFSNDEIDECNRKSIHLGRWLSRSGTVENIYVAWGVRP